MDATSKSTDPVKNIFRLAAHRLHDTGPEPGPSRAVYWRLKTPSIGCDLVIICTNCPEW